MPTLSILIILSFSVNHACRVILHASVLPARGGRRGGKFSYLLIPFAILMEFMEWEKKYIEALINALRPGGAVLQVGYGNGYAAEQIQLFHPSSHVILERDVEKAGRAEKWAKGRSGVRVIEDTWESALRELGVFDAVFFNEFDPQIQMAVKDNLFTSEVVKEGHRLLEEIGQQLPELTRIRYKDHELEEFCQSLGSSAKAQISRFLADLEQNGQITSEQKEKMIRKYKLPESKKNSKSPLHLGMALDPMLLFLKECLRTHMRKGSRFSCFSSSSTSMSEDPLFSDEIIVDPSINYREEIFSAGKKEGLILLIEKVV